MSWMTATRRRWPLFLSNIILTRTCCLLMSLSHLTICNLCTLGKDPSSTNHCQPWVWSCKSDTTWADLSGHGLWPHTHQQWHLQVKLSVSFYMPPLWDIHNQLVSHTMSESFDWLVSHPDGRSVGQSVGRSFCQVFGWSVTSVKHIRVELWFVCQVQREGRIREGSLTERKWWAMDKTATHAHRRGHRVSNYTQTCMI